MYKKRLICWLMVFLLVLSLFTAAQEESTQDSCSGFWGSLSCFFWGNPENRAGKGWFEGRKVVGEYDRFFLFTIKNKSLLLK